MYNLITQCTKYFNDFLIHQKTALQKVPLTVLESILEVFSLSRVSTGKSPQHENYAANSKLFFLQNLLQYSLSWNDSLTWKDSLPTTLQADVSKISRLLLIYLSWATPSIQQLHLYNNSLYTTNKCYVSLSMLV